MAPDTSQFPWYANYYSISNREVSILISVETEGCAPFIRIFCRTNYNGIQHSMVTWMNTDQEQNNMSTL